MFYYAFLLSYLLLVFYINFNLQFPLVMIGVSLIGAGYNVVFHSHEHVRTGLPYQKMRTKPFPWSCPDCDMFDLNCFAECKAAKNAK